MPPAVFNLILLHLFNSFNSARVSSSRPIMLNDAPLSNRKLRPSFVLPVAGQADAAALPLNLLDSLANRFAFRWAEAGEHNIDVAKGSRSLLLPLRCLFAVPP